MEQVILKCTDKVGTPTTKFNIDYAQRILDVKHPRKGWVLDDPAYMLLKGVITKVLKD